MCVSVLATYDACLSVLAKVACMGVANWESQVMWRGGQFSVGPVTVGRKPKQIQRSVCSVSLGQVRGSNCDAWACSKIMETEHRCVASGVRYIRGRCREIIRSDGTPDLFFAITCSIYLASLPFSVSWGLGSPNYHKKPFKIFEILV